MGKSQSRKVDLSGIVAVVEIEGVRLSESQCHSAVHPSEIAEAIHVTTMRDATLAKDPDEEGLFRVEAAFALEVRSATDDEDLQTTIQATFELSYRIPLGESFSSEQLQAFAQVNAVFNAWPYWRELVQSSLARMSMPTLTVPVFRLVPRSAANESEQDEREMDSRTSARDLTRFDVKIAGKLHLAQSKRRMMFHLISGALDHGISPEQIMETIPWRKKSLFEVFDGLLNADQVRDRFGRADHGGRGRRAKRYFCGHNEVFHVRDKTYVLSNNWAKRTLEAVGLLAQAFPRLNISVEPTE